MLPVLARDRARCDFFARRSAFAILLDGVHSGPKLMSRSHWAAATVRPERQHYHDGGNNPEECCFVICGIEHPANLAPDAGGSLIFSATGATASASSHPPARLDALCRLRQRRRFRLRGPLTPRQPDRVPAAVMRTARACHRPTARPSHPHWRYSRRPPAKRPARSLGRKHAASACCRRFCGYPSPYGELRRERSPTPRDAATEPMDGLYRRSLGRSPAPIDEKELLKRLRDRAPFSR